MTCKTLVGRTVLFLGLSFLGMTAEARNFLSVKFNMVLYYSSFDTTQTKVGEVSGLFRVSDDNQFPHLLIQEMGSSDLRVNLSYGNIDQNYSNRLVADSTRLEIESASLEQALLAALPIDGVYTQKVTTLVRRYAQGQILGFRFYESTKEAQQDLKFKDYVQYHDNKSEESLHLMIRVGDQVIIH